MTFVRTFRNSPAVGTDSGEEKSPSTVGYRAYATKDTPSPQEHAHERWEFLNNKTDWATVSAIASEHTNIHDIPKLATFQSFSTQTFYEPSLLSHHHMLFYTHTFHCNHQGHKYSYLPFRPNNHHALLCAQCRSSLASHSARTGLVRLLEFPESAGAISGQTRTGERSSPRS